MLPAHAVSTSSKSSTTTSNKIKINFRLQAVNFHPNLRRCKNEIEEDDILRDTVFIMNNNEDIQLPYVMISIMNKNLKSKSHTDMSFRYWSSTDSRCAWDWYSGYRLGRRLLPWVLFTTASKSTLRLRSNATLALSPFFGLPPPDSIAALASSPSLFLPLLTLHWDGAVGRKTVESEYRGRHKLDFGGSTGDVQHIF